MGRMGVKGRIVFLVGAIFVIAFGMSLATLLTLPNTVRQEIDQDLLNLADRMVQQTSTVDGIRLESIDWPEESFATAGSFYVVLDRTGTVVTRSQNFPVNAPFLARQLIPEEPRRPCRH